MPFPREGCEGVCVAERAQQGLAFRTRRPAPPPRAAAAAAGRPGRGGKHTNARTRLPGMAYMIAVWVVPFGEQQMDTGR